MLYVQRRGGGEGISKPRFGMGELTRPLDGEAGGLK